MMLTYCSVGKNGSRVKKVPSKKWGFIGDLKMIWKWKVAKVSSLRLICVWCIAGLCDLPKPWISTSVKIFKKQSTFHLIRAPKMKRNPLEIKIMKEFRLEGWTVAVEEECSWFLHICLHLMRSCLGLEFPVTWEEEPRPGLSQYNQGWHMMVKHCSVGKTSYGNLNLCAYGAWSKIKKKVFWPFCLLLPPFQGLSLS